MHTTLRLVLTTGLCLMPLTTAAQPHTIVALSHSDNTAYELDPASGKILNKFTAVNRPHERVASPDGKTFYAAIPNGPHVVILDAATFKEKRTTFDRHGRTDRRHRTASP